MKLEHVILGQLIQNPCTGYDIKKHLDTEGRFGMATRPLSQIYNTLKRMVEKGWVEFRVQRREGKPDLKIYSLTEEGTDHFLAYLNSPLALVFRYRESDIVLRLFYSYLIEPDVVLEHLTNELTYREEQIAMYRNRDRKIYSTLLQPGQVEEANEVYEMVHQLGAKGIDDYVALLKDLITYFEHRRSMKS